MTQISTDDVRYLATLSSLQLEDEEVEALRTDIERILDYVAQLGELDTSGVEPTYQVTDLENVWREDIVNTYGVDREALLALSADIDTKQIKVPKVL
ncbi:Asp-tRNA(Asn)/Glu-tRNA(Gln) amidotransferase subunit GatC [Candidatus Saccharibacteria bacterium]|nr:Asp-tRNA(Asn)/Glu-tRNA(Gln) amidotransferase subunit GatC [Candidatus Saccharibacteria bacterium]NCS83226.1 Asp-tRNA(Asn)/Glu-tRNA(Gln) amidotransferase subunit GatC [Candidatus Saccharibacteria bacterium]